MDGGASGGWHTYLHEEEMIYQDANSEVRNGTVRQDAPEEVNRIAA
jgi:hypothetical protein